MQDRLLRTDLLRRSAFWAAHMWNVTKGAIACDCDQSADTAFGVSSDEIEAFYSSELSNEKQWPYFRIALPSRLYIEVEYANIPEDHEVIYRLSRDDSTNPVCVGKNGGSWLLPAFRWMELKAIARSLAPQDPRRAAEAQLLLLPATWLTESDDLSEVEEDLVASWERLGVVRTNQSVHLVQRLTEACRSDVRWNRDERHGWVNDSANSCRNPCSRVSLSDPEFQRLMEFSKAVCD